MSDGARPDRRDPGRIEANNQLPPEPAVPRAIAHEARLLPVAAIDAHLHASNRGRARPGDSANRHLAAADLDIRFRLGNQSPHALDRDRLADDLAVAAVLVPILVMLVIAGERPGS